MDIPYLEAVLGFIVAVTAFHTYLDVRQLQVSARAFMLNSNAICSTSESLEMLTGNQKTQATG
jgi:hypothetical protein